MEVEEKLPQKPTPRGTEIPGEEEPIPDDSPLRKMDNVILAAHNANSSPYYWDKVHMNSVQMLIKGLDV